MTEGDKRLVGYLHKSDIENFRELTRADLILNLRRLLQMVKDLEDDIGMIRPVGENQVIRIQGTHETLISDNKPPDRPGPIFGGC